MTLDAWQVATGCIALLTSLLVWVGKRHIARIDAHDTVITQMASQLAKLEGVVLRKEDLQAMEARLMAAMAAQHTYIVERIARTERTADKAHERLDTLSQRSMT